MGGFVWIALLVAFVVVEMITVGLVSIWFAGGALAALIVYAIGLGVVAQIIAFVVVTVLLLIFTKPVADKYLNSKREKTNYEVVIGKQVRVTETIDNIKGTGAADYNGQIWTARSKNDQDIFEMDELAQVSEIKGVKLILDKIKEN